MAKQFVVTIPDTDLDRYIACGIMGDGLNAAIKESLKNACSLKPILENATVEYFREAGYIEVRELTDSDF